MAALTPVVSQFTKSVQEFDALIAQGNHKGLNALVDQAHNYWTAMSFEDQLAYSEPLDRITQSARRVLNKSTEEKKGVGAAAAEAYDPKYTYHRSPLPKPRGLPNLDFSSCFLNSVMQATANLPFLRAAFPPRGKPSYITVCDFLEDYQGRGSVSALNVRQAHPGLANYRAGQQDAASTFLALFGADDTDKKASIYSSIEEINALGAIKSKDNVSLHSFELGSTFQKMMEGYFTSIRFVKTPDVLIHTVPRGAWEPTPPFYLQEDILSFELFPAMLEGAKPPFSIHQVNDQPDIYIIHNGVSYFEKNGTLIPPDHVPPATLIRGFHRVDRHGGKIYLENDPKKLVFTNFEELLHPEIKDVILTNSRCTAIELAPGDLLVTSKSRTLFLRVTHGTINIISKQEYYQLLKVVDFAIAKATMYNLKCSGQEAQPINRPIEDLGLTLRLPAKYTKDNKGGLYKRVGVLYRPSGRSIDYGHWAFLLNKDNRWLICDDSRVNNATEQEALKIIQSEGNIYFNQRI